MRPEIFIFLDLFPPNFLYCLSLLCYFIHQFMSFVAGYEQKTEQKNTENIERNSRHVISDSLSSSTSPAA